MPRLHHVKSGANLRTPFEGAVDPVADRRSVNEEPDVFREHEHILVATPDDYRSTSCDMFRRRLQRGITPAVNFYGVFQIDRL